MTPPADLEALIGVTAYREYEAAPDWTKDALRAWFEALPGLSQPEFINRAAKAIMDSAVMASYRGNHDNIHARASAAWFIARQRHWDAGHTEECAGDTEYSVAFARAMRSQGHMPPEPQLCSCGRA